MVCLVLVTSRLSFSTSVSSCCRVTSAASHFSQMVAELSGDTAEIQPGVADGGLVTSFLVFGLAATLLRLSAILSWSLSLSPVLEEDSGGEVEEVDVLAGMEENPLSVLRFARFSLFDPSRTANVEG